MGRVVPATAHNLRRAAELLRAGELICFPTETVYGVGADASSAEAVKRIFAAKGRPADHPLIVHLRSADEIGEWAEEVPDSARVLAEKFWPGPLTIVLRRHSRVPLEVTGGQETVAIRVPGHPVARQLLDEFRGALAAPSANRFGRVSPTSAEHAAAELGERVALVIDGGSAEVGVESTIVDLSAGRPRLLRPGVIGRSQLVEALGSGFEEGKSGGAPRVPGALERHYSPSNPTRLVDTESLDAELVDDAVSVLSHRPAPAGFSGVWLELPAEPRGYARGLYSALRELDAVGLPIVVEQPPQSEAWEAINDRLGRATVALREAAEEGVK